MIAVSSSVTVNDWGKFALLLTAIAATTLLAAVGKVSGEAAVGVILYVSGYVTGNGVLARRRQAPSTVLAPKLADPSLPDGAEPS